LNMGLHADDFPADLQSLSDGAITALLERAEEEERSISSRRSRLHTWIDNMDVRSGTALAEFDEDLVAALQKEERALSERRLQLHQTIIDLRVERSWRIDHRRPHLSSVE